MRDEGLHAKHTSTLLSEAPLLHSYTPFKKRMNNERLFIKPTTPLAPTKEKKETPLSKCVKCFGRGETFFELFTSNHEIGV
jgi:hypothetical protein